MNKEWKAGLGYLIAFGYWLLAGLLVGGVCGFAGGAFSIAVEKATHFREHHAYMLYFLPLGGVLIWGLYKLLHLPLSIGTDRIIQSVQTQEKVPLGMAPAIFLSTTITHLTGGSAGREGAALQLGGSIGSAIGDLLHPREDGRRIFELCGMAALFSALFGTPLTATVFVLEIIEVGKFNDRALLPCLCSAVTAKLVSVGIGAPQDAFPLAAGLAQAGPVSLLQAAGLGVAFALCAILFCVAMHTSHRYISRVIKPHLPRILAGGAAVVGLSLLLGTRDYNGGGMHVITAALAGNVRPEAFALKILFTALTLGTGYKGGEIVPSFFVGATLGCALAPLIGFPPALGAALGLVSVFCGVTNAPLASMFLAVELFGTEYLLFFAVAAGIAYMLSGHFSLYKAQVFSLSKLGHLQEEG